MNTKWTLTGLGCLLIAAWGIYCGATPQEKLGAFGPPGSVNNKSTFSYVSGGDGGTVVVPGGKFVSSVWVEGSGSLTITPSAPGNLVPCYGSGADAGELLFDGGHHDGGAAIVIDGGPCAITGPTINVGSGVVYSLGTGNGLRGASNELADGTKIVVSAGTKYVVTENAYGPQ